MNGFQKFLLRGNAVDLAVAVVIGAAFNTVVTGLVKDLIMPLIGAFGGMPDFSGLTFTVNNSRFLIGDFINVLLSFLLIAGVVYFLVVVPVNRLMERFKNEPPTSPQTRECPECLSKIPLAARRCAFCTAVVESSEPRPARSGRPEQSFGHPANNSALDGMPASVNSSPP